MVCCKLWVSNLKSISMLSSYLKFSVLSSTLLLVVSSEFSNNYLQNPGKGVNFYGNIQYDPISSRASAENAYNNLMKVGCEKTSDGSSCHYPGIECLIQNSVPCDYSNPYRTYDGSCNNPHSSRLGMKGQCFGRLLPPYYEGFSGFRKSVTGGPLPEPRELSVKIFKDHSRPTVNATSQFSSFGEYLFLDYLHSVKPPMDCCAEENLSNPECKPISISSDDPFFSQFNKTCLKFRRSLQCSCNTPKRAQQNGVSFYMDESQLYGLNEETVMKGRKLDGTGQLKPQGHKGKELSADSSLSTDKEATCFAGYDPRPTSHVIAMNHITIFMREHNRIAKVLKEINPHWGEEKLFQEARKILSAEHQNILFKEYLSILLSPRIVEEVGLTVPTATSGIQYNSSIIPIIWNEFAISSFRLHSMIPKYIGSLNLRVKQTYNNPGQLCERHLTEMMNGIREKNAEQHDRYMIQDVTNYLFQKPGVPYGTDLLSITIQRGRDHGLAPYVEVVKFCSEGTVLISSFDDLYTLGLMTKNNVDLLKQNYAAVEDVDMSVGMQLEEQMPGAVTGPSAVCINAKQFNVIQKADRFYFDLVGPNAPFTEDQRMSLKKTSWSRFLCDHTDITKVTKNPFIIPSDENTVVSCDEIPSLDLLLWKDNVSNSNTP